MNVELGGTHLLSNIIITFVTTTCFWITGERVLN